MILDNVSLYEAICLIERINERRVFEWKMLALISSYPWFEKKEKQTFMDELDGMAKKGHARPQTKRLDKVGMEALKFAMSQNPRIVVK